MRRFIMGACAAALSIPLSFAYTAAATASAQEAVGNGPRTIVVGPGGDIQQAVDQAQPGDTVFVSPGVYHQDVTISTDGITLAGSGNFRFGTVLEPPLTPSRNFCNAAFGPTGVCIVSPAVTPKGRVLRPVFNDTVTGLMVSGFAGNGVFGFGTSGLTVTHVSAVNDGAYGISRFVSTRTLFADDVAVGNAEAGFYVGDSPHADTLVHDNIAIGNQFGVFVRHARFVAVTGNKVAGNCQGILVLDDGQRGGAGNTVVSRNIVSRNNKFCPKHGDTPINLQGGGILLLGATRSLVSGNLVTRNVGRQLNSGGIVVASARALTKGSNPNFDRVVGNTASRNRPADLVWDGTGRGVLFIGNHCGTSIPPGLCH